MNLNYNVDQVMKAAQYIWDNNPAAPFWPSCPLGPTDIANEILQMAERVAVRNVRNSDRWTSFSGTGGYIIMFSSDDEGEIENIDIDVLVDPAVGLDSRRYVTQTIDLDDIDF